MRSQALSLYRRMLREAQGFVSYNVRSYAVRRVREGFRQAKGEADPAVLENMFSKAKEDLEMLKRQRVVYQLYAHPSGSMLG
ncbi:hypothetical protein PTSG_02247 [Salpingoeca rosetta]|uniref:Complex 1 LYR protein domain-containing protein n=1 Tax=Salpingoeca rosetta (strain ATCC 50818 / BSB-021) TaxID=946362 RepID=F2U1M6_SALR5|nr:uncharacterized protein PTSG_02247 [Salpingoeca rosetta]EGD81528.1 hypothetical protein PTSG_02247 [Salpingoeca rosetta]|eukprot:XP_004996732.1 hypothetical protein PTSG_02247 [Salpingoeca rosetta]